jgi:sulfate adenylyltransferase subunit 2
MRLGGVTLASIKQATGLSSPTIIAAHRAYETGGWPAIAVTRRGRPPAKVRSMTPQTISGLHDMLFGDDAATLGGLWDTTKVCQWWADKHGTSPEPRAVNRLLRQWGIHATAGFDDARHSNDAALQAWVSLGLRELVSQCRREGAGLFWIGHRDISAGSPPPPARARLLYAHNPRGQMVWCLRKGPVVQSDWDHFVRSLPRRNERNTVVIADNPHLKLREHGPHTQPSLRVVYAPLARPAEMRRNRLPSRIDAPLQPTRQPMTLTHLQRLEAESIHIMREVVAESDNPVMLYSIGKDSAVMLRLAMKAFHPAKPPFPLLHVDTGWKFRDMYALRDRMANELGLKMLVHKNPEGVAKGINPFTHGSAIHTDIMKTEGLKQALDLHGFDAAFGGARRDEEKSRAKERIFSFRTAQHRWDPKNQRPELWKLYNTRKHKGESIRVFPISNWTELDIWQYIYLENIPIVPLYFSAKRPVVERDGTLIMVDDDRMPLKQGEVPMMKSVRFRTLGCYPLTGAVESTADTLPAIIQEMLLTKTSERQGRMIDHDSAASMEKKKQEGYF